MGRTSGDTEMMSKPEMAPGEHEIKSYRANRYQRSRAVGGHLLLSDRRLLFYPHKLDDMLGGRSWECSLEEISAMAIADRGSNAFNGSLRPRLQIDIAGETELFLVTNPLRVAAEIEDARRGAARRA